MYFNLKETVNIDSLLNAKYEYYAHLKDDKKETLKEHTYLTFNYFMKIFESKYLAKVFLNIEKECMKDISKEGIYLFRKMLLNLTIFHDIGKINPKFQINKMKNKNILKEEFFSNSDHSFISSILYLDYFIDYVDGIKDKNEKKLLRMFLFINAYIISKHHGDLDDFSEYLSRLRENEDGNILAAHFYEKYKEVYIKGFSTSAKKIDKQSEFVEKYMKGTNKETAIVLYIYGKLIFSLLVASDYYAASDFMNDVRISNFGDIEINEFSKVYEGTSLYKGIRKYEENRVQKESLSSIKDINILRSEMFLDAEDEIMKNSTSDFFFLEAPTGSGKSNTALNLSFKLIQNSENLKKIFYVYPFNTLVEQNLTSLKNIFENQSEVSKKITVINSIYPIKRKKINEKENVEESLLDRQFLNYPMILTTHVSLFDTLFGNTKESDFAFYSLAGSVIVLDEIQSYKNTIWSEIITFLNGLCKILNMKVIIMSATLPNLKSLIGSDSLCVDLIKDREKYFSNVLFKDRVKVNYDLLKETDVYEKLIEHVIENAGTGKKILVEFITKKSAYRFYKDIKGRVEVCELMTGDDNILERKRILNRLGSEEVKEKGIVLAATQVIEAGVDIDMDIGYKDISKLDSEEQFMGRINRSCKKSGIVYFFSLDKEDKVYAGDIRIDKSLTLVNDDIKKILVSKDFKLYYDLVLNILRRNFNESLSDSNLEKFFTEKVGKLKFIDVKERMKLIDDSDYDMSVFLKRVIEDEGSVIDGNKVWEDYKKLLKSNMDYAEKIIRLSEVRSLMNYFIYKVPKNENLCYNDKIGDLICIDDGDAFFNDYKLDKEKLLQDSEIMI